MTDSSVPAAGAPLLAGRAAVVTGAARGIGAAIARTLAQHGARVVLADLDADEVARAAASLPGASGMGCDVTDPEAVARLIRSTVDQHGRLDVVVNNAGITRDASLKRMTLDDFEAVLRVHLRGAWLMIREAAPVMRAAGRGSIVNISSISGKIGNPGQTNYSAAKAGLVGLTKAAARELAHHNVRVNAVAPGLIRTPMTEAMPPEVFAEREASIPMRRAGQPEEVANAVLFLASDLASYITGTVLEVAGGRGM
jgi:Dehydrogenases with different specificities (related to short-chain alcohol dehydrogenases)